MNEIVASIMLWNLTVIAIIIVVNGLDGLSKKNSTVKVILDILCKSIVLLIAIPLSPLSYILINGHKEEHGSYLRYFISAFKFDDW